MFERILNKNKIILVNFFLVLFIALSFFLKSRGYTEFAYYLKAVGSLGLTCSIINWIALQILLDKLYFLYGIDEIKTYFSPAKNFLIQNILAKKNFDSLKVKYEYIITEQDRKDIENNLEELQFNNVIRAFQNDNVKERIKEELFNKLYEIETALKEKLANGLTEEEKNKSGAIFFQEEILPIVEGKLEISVLGHIQLLIYEAMKGYFEWLVLWGAFCGGAFGVLFRFFGCL
ncbi:MAG: hypothetical protein PHY80_02195 [Rickettsiales bacterium]|nr:hypothetical protein [Rickettsiales bacterium]